MWSTYIRMHLTNSREKNVTILERFKNQIEKVRNAKLNQIQKKTWYVKWAATITAVWSIMKREKFMSKFLCLDMSSWLSPHVITKLFPRSLFTVHNALKIFFRLHNTATHTYFRSANACEDDNSMPFVWMEYNSLRINLKCMECIQ